MTSLRSKKGYSLVELSVVLALIAMIVTMVAGFIGTYNKHTYDLIYDRQAMSEITDIKREIEKFIKDRDKKTGSDYSVNANFTVSSGALTSGTDKISLSDGVLKINDVKKKEFDVVKKCEFSFDKINDVENKSIIKCKLEYKAPADKGSKYQMLLFAVFSTTDRSRYSPDGRFVTG